MKIINRFLLILFYQFLISQVAQDFTPKSINSNNNIDQQTIVLPIVDVQKLLNQECV